MSTRPKWTHMVEMSPTFHVYTYEQGDILRAVGDDLYSFGQPVASWVREAWCVGGQEVRVATRAQCKQRTTQPAPHRFILWGPSLSARRILPYLVAYDRNGKETVTEIPKRQRAA